MSEKRPVRIANASGFFGDRMRALREVVEGGPIDFVTGDYLAEVTMMILAKLRAKNPAMGFAPTFLRQLEPVLGLVLERGIKIVVNAGGLNPVALTWAVRALGEKLGVSPKVAMLEGDDLLPRLDALRADNAGFPSLETHAPLSTDTDTVVTANAYLGAFGIVRALDAGADIVICPRVTDASLVVGVAAHWHGWKRDDFDQLAGAVAAGHVIECGPQATGGNYSSFRSLRELSHPAFPIAEVAADGSSVIRKHDGQAGAVTRGTVTAQLVYEIGSPRYLNPDVVTHLDSVQLSEEGPDRVALRGVRGSPPPETTKVAITTRGAFRNEMTFAFVGLDIDAKIEWFERDVRAALTPKPGRSGSALDLLFQRIGSAAVDAAQQDQATVLLRVIASSDDEKLVSRAFSAALVEQGLSSYPGLFALGLPGPASEASGYWPTLVRQVDLTPMVTLPDGSVEAIAPPPVMQVPASPSAAPAPAPLDLGKTVRGPLGLLVDARSGDKGSDANVGLWVESDQAYAWLRGELSVERFRTLLPEAGALAIDRYELPNLRALNFVVHGLLAGGAIASVRFDRQAKALGEFLRARYVDLPKVLLPAPLHHEPEN